jgi:hypothetical protein
VILGKSRPVGGAIFGKSYLPVRKVRFINGDKLYRPRRESYEPGRSIGFGKVDARLAAPDFSQFERVAPFFLLTFAARRAPPSRRTANALELYRNQMWLKRIPESCRCLRSVRRTQGLQRIRDAPTCGQSALSGRTRFEFYNGTPVQ